MLDSSEATDLLLQMLSEANFDSNKPDPTLGVQVLKEFVLHKIDCADDALLFQCGEYSFTGHPMFHFGFVRQFVYEEDGEYDHMEQLFFEFYYEPNEELKSLEMNLWSYDCDSFTHFFEKVLNTPAFKKVTEQYVPKNYEVYLDEI